MPNAKIDRIPTSFDAASMCVIGKSSGIHDLAMRLFVPGMRQRNGGQAAHSDEQKTKQECYGEQPAFVVDDIGRDIRARRANRDDGRGHQNGQRKADSGHKLGKNGGPALATEGAPCRGRKASKLNVLAHDRPEMIRPNNGVLLTPEPGIGSAPLGQSR
jgi:hypothetical protein